MSDHMTIYELEADTPISALNMRYKRRLARAWTSREAAEVARDHLQEQEDEAETGRIWTVEEIPLIGSVVA